MLNINRFSTLLGFEKTLPPMRAARAVQALEKRYRYTFHDENKKEIGKEVLAEAEFIAYELQNGGRPDARVEKPCSKCTVSRCIDENDCSRGKTKHYIWSGGLGTSISKTGYIFAQWLITEGLTTFAAVQAHIEAEKAEKERLAQEAAQSAAEQQAAARRKAQKYSSSVIFFLISSVITMNAPYHCLCRLTTLITPVAAGI
jgi:phage protein D